MEEKIDPKFLKKITENHNKLISNRDELAKSLGLIVIKFNLIDHAIAEIISNLIEFNDLNIRGNIIAILSFKNKVDLMLSLLNEKYKNNRRFLSKIKKDIRKLSKIEEARNRYLHSVWSTGAFGNNNFNSVKYKRNGGVSKEDFNPSKMNEFIDELRLTEKFEVFRLYSLATRGKVKQARRRSLK